MDPDTEVEGSFSHDVIRMPDFPTRNLGHRRAQSEILCLPEDISFESDLGVIGSAIIDGPSLSDEAVEDMISLFLEGEKATADSGEAPEVIGEGLNSAALGAADPSLTTKVSVSNSGERPRARHQHSQSMDGSTSITPDMLAGSGEGPSHADGKKAMSAQDLADLALVDPKRAKRIWANRQSAARSKERKMRYIQELERRVQALQTETSALSAQMNILERDNEGLAAENNELNSLVTTIDQQVRLQDALIEALREEVNRLKVVTGQLGAASSQMAPNGASLVGGFSPSFFGPGPGPQQPSHHTQSMQSLLATQHLQHLQIHNQQQQIHTQLSHLQRQQLQLHLQIPGEMRREGLLASPNRNGSGVSDASGGGGPN